MSQDLIHPGRTAPIALVVQANIPNEAEQEGDLPALESEGVAIADLLHKAGYDVLRLTSGRYSELVNRFADADTCERLVVFHYCGHANGEYLGMADDEGRPQAVSAHGLVAMMAATTSALRLVYMNACLTEVQEDEFRTAFPKVNFVGTKVKIPDYYAKKFALSFYSRLVGQQAPLGQVLIKNALQRAAGADMGLKPKRVSRAMKISFQSDTSGDDVNFDLPDLNFSLAEGPALVSQYVLDQRERRAPPRVLLYALTIITLQWIFLYFSYISPSTSSPAFQAAFGYQPDCTTLAHMGKTLSGVADFPSPNNAALRPACLDGPEEHKLGDAWLSYGLWVEWGRSALLSIVLIILCTLIYRRLPRDYPRFFSRSLPDWLRLRRNRKYLILTVIGFVSIVAYHLTLAHDSLSKTAPNADTLGGITWLQARWLVYLQDASIWSHFIDQMHQNDPRFQSVSTLEYGQPGYFELYERPYLFYLGYSLLNYLASALPLLVVVVNGLSFGAAFLKLRLEGLRVHVRLTRDDYHDTGKFVERRLQNIRSEMAGALARFALTFLLLALFASYEILIGKTTTAFFAVIMMLLVFALVLVGTFSIVQVWNAYRDELTELSELVGAIENDAAYARLRNFERMLRQAYFPLRRWILAIFCTATVLFVYLLWILALGRHWTIFTHELPLLSAVLP